MYLISLLGTIIIFQQVWIEILCLNMLLRNQVIGFAPLESVSSKNLKLPRLFFHYPSHAFMRVVLRKINNMYDEVSVWTLSVGYQNHIPRQKRSLAASLWIKQRTENILAFNILQVLKIYMVD